MIQLSEHGERVVDNFNLIGMWVAVVVCCRNLSICYHQFRRTRGKIHLANLAQVTVFLVHRILYGIIPLFEIRTCAYFPLLVSLWHLTYILFYVVMFMRLAILEHDRYSRWIRITGILLITLRAADWPYELASHSLQDQSSYDSLQVGSQCWAVWDTGVIILNFVGDVLANLFLSGMFVRRLRSHISSSKKLMSLQNKIIEHIAIKSLICLALTFFVNLAMNLLKVTKFLGNRSDAFTVYFEIIESTLLVEALRNDRGQEHRPQDSYCQSCHKELSHATNKGFNNDEQPHSQLLAMSSDKYPSAPKYSRGSLNDRSMNSSHPMQPAIFIDNNRPFDRSSVNPSQSISLTFQGSSRSYANETSLSPPPTKDIFTNQEKKNNDSPHFY